MTSTASTAIQVECVPPAEDQHRLLSIHRYTTRRRRQCPAVAPAPKQHRRPQRPTSAIAHRTPLTRSPATPLWLVTTNAPSARRHLLVRNMSPGICAPVSIQPQLHPQPAAATSRTAHGAFRPLAGPPPTSAPLIAPLSENVIADCCCLFGCPCRRRSCFFAFFACRSK